MDTLAGLTAEQLLSVFRAAHDAGEAERALAVLLEGHSAERIRNHFNGRINGSSETRRFTQSHAEDLASEATIRLINSLRRRREQAFADEIENFGGYVAAICRAVYADFWRERFADYERLSNRIRYLLNRRDSIFVVDRTDGTRARCRHPNNPDHRSIFTSAEIADRVRDLIEDYPVRDELYLTTAALEQGRGWLLVSDLVRTIADLRGVSEVPPAEYSEDSDGIDSIPDGRNSSTMRGEIFELTVLWSEIRQLHRFQKLALLYHLRDGDGRELNTVWFESGVATLSEIAEQFEVPEYEMAGLLVRLPLSDKQIAESLGIVEVGPDGGSIPSHRRVSNLRKVARAYLQRRLDGKERRKR